MAVSKPPNLSDPTDPYWTGPFTTATGIGVSGSVGIAPSTHRVYPQPPDGITERMLEQDVFKVPMDSLVDIWLLRFGNTWVNLDDIEKDEFFKMAYQRLKSVGKLEVHYLTDRAKYVCRKPE